MSNDIKEILKTIKGNWEQIGKGLWSDDVLSPNELKCLYNYISELQTIIKEVREYIGLSDELRKLCTYYDVNGIDILEILDKAGSEDNE